MSVGRSESHRLRIRLSCQQVMKWFVDWSKSSMKNKSTLKIAEEQFLLRVLAINGRGWGSYRIDRKLSVHNYGRSYRDFAEKYVYKFSINHSKTWQMNWLKDALSSDVDGFLPTSPRKKLKAIVKGTLNNTKLTVECLRSVAPRRKGDVTRDDSQRRFLAQHRVAMLEQCWSRSKQCCNNVATLCCAKNRRCELSLVTSP